MKVRTGFVSNSSSSSFIIKKEHLSEIQMTAIRRHEYIGKLMGIESFDTPWGIEENENTIFGSTYMDNFNMNQFLRLICVDRSHITWSD